MNLPEAVILITGAGSGIGRALAESFARHGARVVCAGRREAPLAETVARIKASGGKAFPLVMDVTDERAVRSGVGHVIDSQDHIDVLFNNAGRFTCIAGVQEADPSEWWGDVTTNLLGPFLLMRYVLPHMLTRNYGVVINMNGGRPPGGSSYAASKAGLMELTRVLTLELKKAGSNVIVLSADPGFVRTPMTEHQARSEAGRHWLPGVAKLLAQGKTRPATDIAEAAVRIVAAARPEMSGKHFGPDTQPEDLLR